MGALGRRRRADLAALLLLIALGLGVLAPGLGHPMIVSWDEGAHQAVTRGLHDTWLPVIYRDPLVPIADYDWFAAGVFLHKPTLPFFLGALLMRLTGVTPLALRLVSLVGEIGAAALVFLLARRDLGRALAFVLGCGVLLLPFGWRLVQGLQFGDVTDCSLVGLVSLSFLFLVRAVEHESDRDALGAGAACGAAFLCKSALAITPVGAALVLGTVHATGFLRGLSWRQLALLLAATLAVALPYNLYCWAQWPSLFWRATTVTWSHLNTGVGVWEKPVDGLFNEIGTFELGSLPMVFFLVAGLWLLVVAHRDRSPTALVAALWLWGEWVPLSYAKAKVPATMWGAVPAMFLAAGYLLRDGLRSPAVGLATLGALCSAWVLRVWPALSTVRDWVPASLPQTKTVPGLAEGLVLVALGAALGVAAKRAWGTHWRWPGYGALAVTLALIFQNGRSLAETRATERARFPMSYTDVLGRALDATLPERSVLFLDLDADPPGSAEKQNLMFWSGRMVYPPQQDLLRLARERGYHPYVISSLAEPFERVEAVPAAAWLQAFDVDQPLRAASPKTPADLRIPSSQPSALLGVGVGETVAGKGRYAIYLRPSDALPLPVVFGTPAGPVTETLDAAGALVNPARFQSAAWLELPLLGPPTRDVQSLQVGDARVTLEATP